MNKVNKLYQFDVALSFSGKDRNYVEKVAQQLLKMEIRVFYDKYETGKLWGKNLYTHLTNVYQSMARFAVIFISKHYAKSVWTNLECQGAQARSLNENQEYILPARFDNTEVAGLLPTIVYVDLKKYSPKQLAELIKEKVGPLRRFEYFPENPDRLFKLTKKEGIKNKDANILARHFFDNFKLMTVNERKLLVIAIKHSCPTGLLENNIHLEIDYLGRLTSSSIEDIKASFSRLDCLGLKTLVYKQKKQLKDQLCKERNVIKIEYCPLLENVYIENATFILYHIIDVLSSNSCPECFEAAIENADFSILSSLTGFSELNGS